MSERMEFTLADLSRLDNGKALKLFNLAMQSVVTDCMDRPAEPKARKVTLTLEVKPVKDQNGNCETIDVGFAILPTTPPYLTHFYPMKPHKGGKLSFHPDLPEEATLFHRNEPQK